MENPYQGREQSRAKHLLLKNYLQALAFKVLTFKDLVYVDGFSGPWESRTEDFHDTSFMIAIQTLLDAQQKVAESRGKLRRIHCIFCEKNRPAFEQLQKAVQAFHRPDQKFEISTFCGKFEDVVPNILPLTTGSFVLTFIDPTGWTGYPYSKVAQLLRGRDREVVINFMFDYANRFTRTADPEIDHTFDPILGGEGWRERLRGDLSPGDAVVELFRETLRKEGQFEYVAVAPIEKNTADRTHFVLAYGTRKYAGLCAFRDAQAKVMPINELDRQRAKVRDKSPSGQALLFTEDEAPFVSLLPQSLEETKKLASAALLSLLAEAPQQEMMFEHIAAKLLEKFPIRETHLKDVCNDLAARSRIHNTWVSEGLRRRKPTLESKIQLKR